LAEPFDSRIASAEEPGSLRVIARAATNIAAFVGRTLKGPVNEPVLVRSFSDFTRVFGGLWQPSTLSYAVEQFFENGGRGAVIVRVVNGARPPTLTLPTGGGKLLLRGVGAGSREFLRASVDYDAIDAKDTHLFNLVVQRVRTAGSEAIEDQEIFRRLSIRPGADRFVADQLLESRLVRVQGSVPMERPTRTPAANNGAVIGYTPSNPDGDDGGPITDYDVIGSAQLGTGIFALQAAPDIRSRATTTWGCRPCWWPAASAASVAPCSSSIRRPPGRRAPPRSMACATGRSAVKTPQCSFRASWPSTGCADVSSCSRPAAWRPA
jgi:hypothetical protein